MKHTTKLLLIVATAVSTVAFAGAGWAYWTTIGSGTGSASVGTVASPTNVQGTSTAGTGTVGVTWTGVSAPNGVSANLGYWVQRSKDGGAYTDACASSHTSPLTPSTVASCNDTGLADGSYTYKVTAVFRSWTAQSGASTSVIVSGDNVPPTVTITTVNGAAVTFPFSTNANVTSIGGSCGTATGDSSTVAVAISTLNTTVSCTAGTWSWSLTAAISAAGSYTVTASQTDAAGNTGTSGSRAIIIDKTAPAVTVNQKTGQADPTNTLPIAYTVTFSEPVTGFDATDLTRTGTSTGGTVTVSGSGASYEISVTGTPTNGTLSFSVGANTATDAAGNNNTASTSTDNTVTYDTAGPQVTSVTSTDAGGGAADGTIEAGDAFSVTFNEAIDPLTVPAGTQTVIFDRPANGSATVAISNLTLDGTPFTDGREYVAGKTQRSYEGTLSLSADWKTITFTVSSTTFTCTAYSGGTCPGALPTPTARAVTGFRPAATLKDPAGNVATGTFTTPGTIKYF